MDEAKSLEDSSQEVQTGFGHRLGRMIDGFEVMCLSIGVGMLTILLIANVFFRTFFQSIYFIEEVGTFLIIFITFIGISYAARKARHIRMGALLDLMPPKLEKAFIFVITAVSALVLMLMSYHALIYVIRVKNFGQTSPALRIPSWTVLVIVPLGFLSAGIQYARTFMKNLKEKDVWQSPEQKSEYEEELYH